MSKEEWYSGPPPSCGWWPASAARCPHILRWWNGERWSLAAREGLNYSDSQLNKIASIPSVAKDFRLTIEWAPRPKDWPDRSKT